MKLDAIMVTEYVFPHEIYVGLALHVNINKVCDKKRPYMS